MQTCMYFYLQHKDVPWLFAWTESVLCNIGAVCPGSSTLLEGHAARVALVDKGGSTPFLVLREKIIKAIQSRFIYRYSKLTNYNRRREQET